MGEKNERIKDVEMKVRFYRNNGIVSIDQSIFNYQSLKIDFIDARSIDLIIEIDRKTFFIKYLEIDDPNSHNLDYLYYGICDEDFNVQSWIGRLPKKEDFNKKIFLFGQIIIDEDLCNQCDVRFIDPNDFEPNHVNDVYDYEILERKFNKIN